MLPPSLDHLPAATQELLGERTLLERVDRKFVTHDKDLRRFVSGLDDRYHFVAGNDSGDESDGTNSRAAPGWMRYETCYYDTDSLQSFNQHVRGRRPRFKIRVRRHVDRRRAFLEIKCKGGNDRTEKQRLVRDYALDDLTEEERAFIAQHTPFDASRLVPSMRTSFYRATLLGAETEERITIDLNLQFERNGQRQDQDNLAIIELKQRRISNTTPAALRLHELHIRERSLSKYCTGVANLHEHARPKYRTLLLRRLARL